MKKLLTLLVLVPVFLCAMPRDTTQSLKKRVYQTEKSIEYEIAVDGILDDPAWSTVDWADDFTVQFPNNGDKPKRQTKFKILIDNGYVYAAFRCYDEEPGKIESRLARRDQFPGDWVEINIDSYHDLSTAFSFTTSASGVKGDEFVTQNGNNWDSNWNPVWYNATNIDDEGWTAEVKIPLSQLRFDGQSAQTWGVNVMRRDFRADERSTWQWIPQNASGWVSNFGELHGVNDVKPKRQVELQPYISAQASSTVAEEGNPFRDGSDIASSIGLDGKIGITSDLTLDFTINPDFGQVEADPSRLTLDGFQIFFDERRPFFIENANLFGFRITSAEAGGNFNSDNLFYSRRIGQSPRGNHDISEEAYSDAPDFTSIIGAAKFSGKTKNGLSIGILESVTAEEKLMVSDSGNDFELVAEPLTNYFVGRISQDINQGATIIGGTLTSTTRRLENTGLEDQYHSDALSGGLNLFHSWKDREWQITGNFIFSNVQGTATRIAETQQSFEHYFQRPDADHLGVDESSTSLSGHGGTVTVANYGGKDNFSFQTGATWRSPGLELNDIGFLNTADEINHFFWGGWRAPKAVGRIRRFQINYNHYSRWTYGGEHLYSAINMNAHTNFKNTWSLSMGSTYEMKDISAKALFGGPLLRQARGFFNWISVRSDNRKKFNYGFWAGRFSAIGTDKDAVSVFSLNTFMSYQPTNALRLSFSPDYFTQQRAMQNVTYDENGGNDRYIVATVDQRTLSLSMRINYSLTPNLTIQYWGQPFISRGNYSEFKYITDPLALDYHDRFHAFTHDQIAQGENADIYYVYEDNDRVSDYSFDNPDFNFLQFRSNLVLRWEYKPGSEFFLVWTQSTTNTTDPSKRLFPSLREDLFTEKINNIFLMKFTYRFLNN